MKQRVRARTLAYGVVLGTAVVAGFALAGGVGPAGDSRRGDRPEADHGQPLQAVQPELDQALLTGSDPSPAGPPATPTSTAPVGPLSGPSTAPAAEPSRLPDELCRLLFEDPAGLPGLWSAEPEEVTSGSSRHGDGALRQTLALFDGGDAEDAYRQVREEAGRCDRFPARLEDEGPVTVILRELTGDRRESTRVEEGYAMNVAVTDPAGERLRSGWLLVDRVGPVISVLRHLAPDHAPDQASGRAPDDDSDRRAGRGRVADPDSVREVAVDKLRGLLSRLTGGRHRSGR